MTDGTWHQVEAFTREGGRIEAFVSTNDNEDRGVPGPVESWTQDYRDRDLFDRCVGKSRIGCLGCEVTVILDGVRL